MSVIFRRGDRGPEVKRFQEFLIEMGFLPEGENDGIAGRKTDLGLKTYQASRGLAADGACGPKTLAAAHADGFGLQEPEPDLIGRTAKNLGIDPDLMRAFVKVESGGRASAVRFEPHLAHRKLGDRAAEIPYTPQSNTKRWSLVRSETSRAAFDRALAMHEDEQWRRAIIESSSFGLFQVLGRHLIDMFGVDEAVPAFDQDPEVISHALLASWFRANPAALRIARSDDPNIEELVAHYNGRGPNVARYSAKLRSALAAIKARA
jgi:hypothetical protein